MTVIEERGDTKAGYSSMCRRDDHAMCRASRANCTCRCHGRNGSRAPTPSQPKLKEPHMTATAAALKAVPEISNGVTVELVAEDPPPARSGRRGVADQIVALLPDMAVGRWYKVATFTAKSSANSARVQLQKRGIKDVEWAARVTGNTSALYARKK